MAKQDLDQAFWAFHNANPEVYRRLRQLALQAKATGKRKVGIKLLVEVLRWEHYIDTARTDDFKINNNLSSRYARCLMHYEPELRGFFDLRGLHQ